MKKDSSGGKSPKQGQKRPRKPQPDKKEQQTGKGPLTIGRDPGDRTSRYCILDRDGETVRRGAWGARSPR